MFGKTKKTPALPLPPKALPSGAWLGLIVDDDEGSRNSVRLALARESVFGRPIALEFADSAAAAKKKLSEDDRFVFAIVDVVMEAQDSGLELVDWIRSHSHLAALRLAIRTGYAGLSDQEEMVQKYDILDFRCKSDFSRGKLLGVIATLARPWSEIQSVLAGERAMEELAHGVQDLAEAQSPSAFVACLGRTGAAALAPWGIFEASASHHDEPGAPGVEVLRGLGLPDINVRMDASEGWPSQSKVARRLMASARAAYGNLAEVKKLEAMAYADPVTGLAGPVARA